LIQEEIKVILYLSLILSFLAFLVAKSNILPGEEIFISYGFEYWKWFYEVYGEK